MFLQQFDYEIKHKKGRIHSSVDALSRIPCSPKHNRLKWMNNITKIYLYTYQLIMTILGKTNSSHNPTNILSNTINYFDTGQMDSPNV